MTVNRRIYKKKDVNMAAFTFQRHDSFRQQRALSNRQTQQRQHPRLQQRQSLQTVEVFLLESGDGGRRQLVLSRPTREVRSVYRYISKCTYCT